VAAVEETLLGKPAGPADLSIEVSPKRIDSGDRTHVEVKLSEFSVQQIQLKVRFPDRTKLCT
jgi:hypothetical protein